MTVLALLQLVEVGQTSFDAPATHYLRGFELVTPSAAATVTVRQLLNRTSGLADAGFTQGLNGQEPTFADRVVSLFAMRAQSMQQALRFTTLAPTT